MELNFKRIFIVNLILSIIVISVVYILQYYFKLPPCDMCIKERYPYYILIIISIFFLVFKNNKIISLILSILSGITILTGTLYTIYHVGIERGLLEGQSSCSSIIEASNSSALLKIIEETPLIRCDEPTIIFNVISLAELNLISMSLLLLLNLIVIYLYVRKK